MCAACGASRDFHGPAAAIAISSTAAITIADRLRVRRLLVADNVDNADHGASRIVRAHCRGPLCTGVHRDYAPLPGFARMFDSAGEREIPVATGRFVW